MIDEHCSSKSHLINNETNEHTIDVFDVRLHKSKSQTVIISKESILSYIVRKYK